MVAYSPRKQPELSHGPIISLKGLQALAIVLTTIAIALTIGRVWIRGWKARALRWDDILNTLAAILLIPCLVAMLLYLRYPFELQMYDLGLRDDPPPPVSTAYMLRIQFVFTLLFWLVLYTVKASFLALYWYLFEVSTRFRIAWWITMIFTAASFAATCLLFIWHCGSPEKLFDEIACHSQYRYGEIVVSVWCALNITGGLMLLAIPIAMVNSEMLTLKMSQRIGLMVIFALVLVDITFDLVRTVYALDEYLSLKTNLNGVWSICEPTIAVIVCALPHYRSVVCRTEHHHTRRRTSLDTTWLSHQSNVPLEMDEASAGCSLRSGFPSGSDVSGRSWGP